MESASSTNLLILQLQPLHVTSSGLGMKAILRMCLLALLYGLQPSLTRKFTPETINRNTVVSTLLDICQIPYRGYGTGAAVLVTGGWADAIVGWNVKACLTVGGIHYLCYYLLCCKLCNSHCLSNPFAEYTQHLESDKDSCHQIFCQVGFVSVRMLRRRLQFWRFEFISVHDDLHARGMIIKSFLMILNIMAFSSSSWTTNNEAFNNTGRVTWNKWRDVSYKCNFLNLFFSNK
jgi:hypothetical protein